MTRGTISKRRPRSPLDDVVETRAAELGHMRTGRKLDSLCSQLLMLWQNESWKTRWCRSTKGRAPPAMIEQITKNKRRRRVVVMATHKETKSNTPPKLTFFFYVQEYF